MQYIEIKWSLEYLKQSTTSTFVSDCTFLLQVYNLQRELQKKDYQLAELRKQMDEHLRREEPTAMNEEQDQQQMEKDGDT